MIKKIIIILLFPVFSFGQKLDYAEEFTYEIYRNLDYVGNGNIRQALDIYIPYNRISDKLPLIVYIHGGGWRRGSKNFAGRGMPKNMVLIKIKLVFGVPQQGVIYLL